MRPARARVPAILLVFAGTFAVLVGARRTQAEEHGQWIVVAAPAFRAVLEPLAARRRAEGFHVRWVDVSEIEHAERVQGGDGRPLRSHLRALCEGTPQVSRILLVGPITGSGRAGAAAVDVPALEGTIGRMAGQPSDNGYGCLDDDLLPGVAVGRFPARDTGELEIMVAKTLAFERSTGAASWRERVTLLVGHPGGSSPLERRLASMVVKTAIGSGLEEVHPRWRPHAIVHAPDSPFCVPEALLEAQCVSALERGQMLSVYLGHSSAAGLWSLGQSFLTRETWADLRIAPGRGVFLSCGCYACQLVGRNGEGHGLTAVRSPGGPVAVIGAHGESYGAMGKLAFEGLLPLLAAAQPPTRLGDWWLAVKRGLARGRIGKLTFLLYDRADGSGGRVPLEEQRQEHLEMWMLLGDPALRLPLRPLEIAMDVDAPAAPGRALLVRGTLPARFATLESVVRIAVERPFGTTPLDLEPLPPAAGAGRDRALMRRYEQANDVELASADLQVLGVGFECRLELPPSLPWASLTVRVRATSGAESAHGAIPVSVDPAASAEN